MNKILAISSTAIAVLIYVIFYLYPNADLIIEEHSSIDYLHNRGWVSLDRKFFEESSKIRSATDLDSNDYIISISLNDKQISSLKSYLLKLKCIEKEVSSKKLEPLFGSGAKDYPIAAFLYGRDCGVQGEWILDKNRGLAISTSIFPFDSRVLEAYKNKFQ